MEFSTQEAISAALRTAFILGKEEAAKAAQEEREKSYMEYCKLSDLKDAIERELEVTTEEKERLSREVDKNADLKKENANLRKRIEDTGIANQERNYAPFNRDYSELYDKEYLKTQQDPDTLSRLKNAIHKWQKRDRKAEFDGDAVYISGVLFDNERFVAIVRCMTSADADFAAIVTFKQGQAYFVHVTCSDYASDTPIRRSEHCTVDVHHDYIHVGSAEIMEYHEADNDEKRHITRLLAEYGFASKENRIVSNCWE